MSQYSELICFQCGAEYTDKKECPEHPGLPLLDPNEPEVIEELKKREAKLKENFSYKLAGYGFLAGAVPGFVLGIALSAVVSALGSPVAQAGVATVFGAIGAGIGWVMAPKKFESPYDGWTDG